LSEEVAEGEIGKGHGRCYTARAMLGAKKATRAGVAVGSESLQMIRRARLC
jgi:hypothetical protein